jgi:cytoplasmic iron level regulating protein YaaA (DUF328/UPF0246 family)
MIAIISPAKTIDFSKQELTKRIGLPEFDEESLIIMEKLKSLSKNEISGLMKIKGKLLEDNYSRIHLWEKSSLSKSLKQALLCYKGEVFNGIEAMSLSEDDLLYSENKIRILSAVYGILKPLDGIMPYRLEMQSGLKVEDSENLYSYWNNKINSSLEKDIRKSRDKTLINLASNEYSKVVDIYNFKHRVINIYFKDYREGNKDPKVVTIYAKKARGMMCRYIIKERIEKPENLKLFDGMGYMYDDKLSNENDWVFTR